MVWFANWGQVLQIGLQIINLVGWPVVVATIAAVFMKVWIGSLDWLILGTLFFVSFLFLVGKVRKRLIHSLLGLGVEQSNLVIIGLVLLVGLGAHSMYLHWRLREMSKRLDCHFARGLTPDQFAEIVTYLKDHKPDEVKVSWLSHDKTSSCYAERLSEAFRQGDWLVGSDSTPENLLSGVTVFYRSNEATQKANESRRRSAPPNPGEIMKEAIKHAGLRGSNVINYSPDPDPKLKDHEYKIVVTVGRGPYLLGCDETEEDWM